ncbi:MAG: Holliday junction branch migration protein RuvA [Thermovenabulum sp.]|uniref:Holliday junction branch migration protein RuvA n=1 Tax=Thermovenabulum sp. TaxID=3100335 RepID=UPI003C7A1E40
MFEYIKGILIEAKPSYAIVETNGLGYKLNISYLTYEKIKGLINKEIMLYSLLVVKEDALEIYGFYEREEREFFIKLNKVSGIGPKLALSILSYSDINLLKSAINSEDVSKLSSIPGIGKKTAQKMILELKDKIKFSGEEGNSIYEAREVLLTLGFSLEEINKAFLNIDKTKTTEEIVKEALKFFSK